MSRYVRDDKQFRAQIAKLADAGLILHVGANTIPQTPKGKLPEFLTGLVTWALLGGAAVMAVRYVLLPVLYALAFGGDR